MANVSMPVITKYGKSPGSRSMDPRTRFPGRQIDLAEWVNGRKSASHDEPSCQDFMHPGEWQNEARGVLCPDDQTACMTSCLTMAPRRRAL
jgi:hypothetical protein